VTRDPTTDLYDVVDGAAVVRVHVQPGAGKTAVVGRHGRALKLRVAAPPVGGKANAAAAELLASTFGVKEKEVELVAGDTSRLKRYRVKGVEVEDVDAALRRVLADADARVGEPRRRPT
jgi:uncharacterized protein (TIGR00251 family)